MFYLQETLYYYCRSNVSLTNLEIKTDEYVYNCMLVHRKIFKNKELQHFETTLIDPFCALKQTKNEKGLKIKNILNKFIDFNNKLNKNKSITDELIPFYIKSTNQQIRIPNVVSNVINILIIDVFFETLNTINCLYKEEEFKKLIKNYNNQILEEIQFDYYLNIIQKIIKNFNKYIQVNNKFINDEQINTFFMKYIINNFHSNIDSHIFSNYNNQTYKKLETFKQKLKFKIL
jgi:hypothetical protein